MNTISHGLLSEHKEIVKDLKSCSNRFIKYQIGTKMLIGIFLLPLFKIILNLLMKSRGFSAISNGLILKYILSPQGFISLFLTLALSVLVILIEIGGLIIISHQAYTRDEESSFYTILKFSLNRFKNLIGIGGFLIVLYLLVLAPWISIGLNTSLVSSIEIPGFIQQHILEHTALNVLLKIITVTFFILSIRWIFALHIIILENQSASGALKKSSYLIKHNLKIFVKKMLGISLITVAVLIITSLIFLIIALGILSIVDINTTTGDIVFASLLLIMFLLLVGFGSFAVPFEVHHLTRLYYSLNGNEIPTLDLESKNNKLSMIDKIFKHKKVLTIVFSLIFIASSFIASFILNEMNNLVYDVKVTAHRGSSTEAPENSIAALEVAIRNGADYAEIDVQETKDGRIILLHDSSLKRVTGVDKNIWEVTLAEIKELDSGSWFDEKFENERIPTLEEVIDYTKGKIQLNIEIKRSGHEKNLVDEVIRIIEEKDLVDSCVVTSLDYDLLQEVEELNSEIRTGYIMYAVFGNLSTLDVDFYSVEESNVNDKFVNRAHLLGKEVHVWTINEKRDMTKMIDLGVDNIITDNDKTLRNVIEKMNSDQKSYFE